MIELSGRLSWLTLLLEYNRFRLELLMHFLWSVQIWISFFLCLPSFTSTSSSHNECSVERLQRHSPAPADPQPGPSRPTAGTSRPIVRAYTLLPSLCWEGFAWCSASSLTHAFYKSLSHRHTILLYSMCLLLASLIVIMKYL